MHFMKIKFILGLMASVGIALTVALGLTGCSIGMAANGRPNPQVELIKPGVHRAIVEGELGKPVQAIKQTDGTTLVEYVYEVDDAPSAKRAVLYGAMDVVTLGLWEVVGTPLEATQAGLQKLQILLDRNQRVLKIFPPQNLDKAGPERLAYWKQKLN
jgi:hypothetical protein